MSAGGGFMTGGAGSEAGGAGSPSKSKVSDSVALVLILWWNCVWKGDTHGGQFKNEREAGPYHF